MKNCPSIIIFLLAFLFVFPVQTYAKVWINEFSSYGSSDWIELYNDGEETVSLVGFRLRDNTTTNKLDLDGQLDPHGYNVFEWGSKLNNGGDTIRLVSKTDENTILDKVIYPGDVGIPPSGQTAGRQTDGGPDWVLFAKASKGSTNADSQLVPTATPVPINTPTPIKQPTPTRMPTPTRIPTPTKPAPTKPIPTKSDPEGSAADSKVTLVKSQSDKALKISGIPTSILGIATKSAVANLTPNPTIALPKLTMVKDASSGPDFIIIAGVLCCVACGILVVLKFWKERHAS